MLVSVTRDGPYVVTGSVPLARQHIVTNAEGESLEWREGESFPAEPEYRLCRCGGSSKKPFCDGTHKKSGFDGTETATRAPYREQAQQIDGPTMSLTDAEGLCAFARFCDPQGQVWNLVGKTDHAQARKLVEHEAGHCPGGRLVAIDRKSGRALEPELPRSIGFRDDR